MTDSTRAERAWRLFHEAAGRLDLVELNRRLEAEGLAPITQRTYLHLGHLLEDGFQEYRSINAHDQWRKARRERERRRRTLEAGWSRRPREGAVLARVRIRGLRAILDAELDCGRVNVLIGPNGAGKTAVLEALTLLGAAASGVPLGPSQLYDRGGRHGGPRNLLSRLPGEPPPVRLELVSTAPETGAAPLGYAVEMVRGQGTEEWRVRHETLTEGDRCLVRRLDDALHVLDESPRSAPAGAGAAFLSLPPRDAWRSIQALRDRLDRFAIFQAASEILRGEVLDPRPRKPLGLNGAGLADAIDELLDLDGKKLGGIPLGRLTDLLGWADQIEIREPGASLPASMRSRARVVMFRDRHLLAEDGRLVVDLDVSEGALHLAFLAALCEHPLAPPILAIEQPETAFHPRLAIATMRLVFERILADPQRQLFVTSHSPAVLDALPTRAPDVRLFAVDRSVGGATLVRRIPLGEDIDPLLADGTTLSKLWLSGALGAVPNL